MKKLFVTLAIIVLIYGWKIGYVEAATTTPETVYSEKGEKYIATDKYSYRDQTSMTVNFTAGKIQGQVITNIRWENSDGKKLRDVPGDWLGKESFAGLDTIQGTSILVRTTRSHTHGGVYYWDRSSGSDLWRANTPRKIRHNDSGKCPSAPEDEWKYKAYPNCTDDLLTLVLKKDSPYYIDGEDVKPSIDEKVVVQNTVKPVNIGVDPAKTVENDIHKECGFNNTTSPCSGKYDRSTKYDGKFEVISKNSIMVYFEQTFGGDSEKKGFYKDWASPGARQMWWYSAFKFQLEATTYRYGDKKIVVEWGPKENEPTQINVRHMVRTGPTGSFVKVTESMTPFADPLPLSRILNAEPTHGKVLGRNVSYSNYSDTVQSGNTVTVSLSRTQTKAYVTFFYEKEAPRFSGDFDIIPDTINFRQPFRFVPKNFVMAGCTYQSHRYKIERGGTYTTSPIFGQSTDTSYTFSSYPWVIGIGSHTVSINIKTSCGESGWTGHKTLTVNDMAGNNPPQFKIGFVHPHYKIQPIREVVEGTVLDLVYIDDPSVPTPTDPDGDSLHFMGFDTANGSPFIQSLPSKYDEYTDGYHNVTMDVLGYHHVTAQMRDEWGLTTSASTSIKVIPKNPVPIAKCPVSVKSMRSIATNLFDSSESFSPMGRKINHARDEWIGRLPHYVNETNTNQFATVSLHVYDSEGLKSLSPSNCSIIVKPDLPPVAKLEVPSIGIRKQTIEVINRSVSPDDDKITGFEYKFKYDSKNNGFGDDQWNSIIGGTLLSFPFTPDRVGKYLFYTKVREDYGRTDDTLDVTESEMTLDVINDAPEVAFNLEGKNEQPDLDPYSIITPGQMMKWNVYDINSTTKVRNKSSLWSIDQKNLVAGEGRNFGPQQQVFYDFSQSRLAMNRDSFEMTGMVNNGFGNNRLSPYRSSESLNPTYSLPIIDPKSNKHFQTFNKYRDAAKFKIRSNKKNIFFNKNYDVDGWDGSRKEWELYALNPSKLQLVEQYLEPNEFFYSYRYSGNKQPYDFKITRYTTLKSWELADKYIYIHETPNDDKDVISVYDALTGALLKKSTDVPGTDVNVTFSHAKGKNIVTYRINQKDGVQTLQWIEYDPNLKVVANVTLPSPNKIQTEDINDSKGYYSFNVSPFMVDAEGSIYSYQTWTYPDAYTYSKYRDLNVTKYNSDYSIAWRKYLTPYQISGPTLMHSYVNFYNITDTMPSLVFDYSNNEVLAKVYYDKIVNREGGYEEVFVLNASTGQLKTSKSSQYGDDLSMYHYGNYRYDAPTSYSLNWNGARISGPNSTVTIDGNRTSFLDGATCTIGSYTSGFNNVKDSAGNNVGRVGVPCNHGQQLMGEYFMDGVYVSLNKAEQAPNGSSDTSLLRLNVSIGAPSTRPAVISNPFTSGQFMSTQKMVHAEVKFSYRMDKIDYDKEWFGYSFRMKDTKNRYAIEADGKNIVLAKYINGQRTELDTGTYPMQDKTDYNIRLKFLGEKIEVWLNNIPILTATDNEYQDGFFGYWANKSHITFSQLQYKALEDLNLWSNQYAILEEDSTAEIKTDNIEFKDPENDPAAELGWKLYHKERFINNQGKSALDGKTITSGNLKLDKVGDYLIALKGRDDPHPSYLMPSKDFDEYRKYSNEFKRNITVHRRPIANFTVVQRSYDGRVLWTDSSLDPDRYESAAVYSTEDTGIDYKVTKGIMEKRFYYITPSGEYVPEKLVTPQETGTYEVALAVKDEYGAWSGWAIRSLVVGKKAALNTPPISGFTKSHITTYRGVTVTIDSTASDKEDGARENLAHTYYVRNKSENGPESIKSTSRTNWTTSFNKIGTYSIRQLIVDSHGATAQKEQEIMIVNRKPTATITTPESTNQSNPTKMTVLRPDFMWAYGDGDQDVQKRYQVQIYRYGGHLVLDSKVVNLANILWSPSIDLPEKTNMYVQVRVHDGFEWGDWSTVRYFYIETNQAPTADFTWSPQPVYEGDIVTFSSLVNDPDKDNLSLRYELKSPTGVKSITDYSFNDPYPNTGPSQKLQQVGIWTMKLTVSDGKAEPVEVSKSIQVLPLSVAGFVKHTDIWNEHRKKYNTKKSGNEESPRGYNTYWAGEKFLLFADTTATISSTVANRVEASFGEFTVNLSLVGGSKTTWGGELWYETFEKLEDGPITFVYSAYYSNGTIKTTSVEVIISGEVGQVVGVHRVK